MFNRAPDFYHDTVRPTESCACKETWSTRLFFEEVLEELRQEYQGAVLSDQVPTSNNEEMEDYLKSLWAAARKVTKENRRKVVTKHDIMSALYNWADIIL
ncbi:hypothetical protein CEXT_164091 [Caerostris extrusa]|uniref:Uncharacterized protein n=1 Tax=Caerostris extrusa TaxID=172846 RepID=A0AAV4QB55_CAEEX|nr:hypothetical protein CEXT_164091 [Caerostris extrusa]